MKSSISSEKKRVKNQSTDSPAIFMTIFHSFSKTGCTESLPNRIKAILARDFSALI
jgi:hypothetical protein